MLALITGGTVEGVVKTTWYIWQADSIIGSKYMGAGWCQERSSLSGKWNSLDNPILALFSGSMPDVSKCPWCSFSAAVLWDYHLEQAFVVTSTFFLLVILVQVNHNCFNTSISYLLVEYTQVEEEAQLLDWLPMLQKILKLGKLYDSTFPYDFHFLAETQVLCWCMNHGLYVPCNIVMPTSGFGKWCPCAEWQRNMLHWRVWQNVRKCKKHVAWGEWFSVSEKCCVDSTLCLVSD